MRKYSVVLLAILSILLSSCAQQKAYAEQEMMITKTTLNQKSQNLNNIDPELNQLSPTPEPTSTLRPSSTPLASPTPIPSFTTVPSATPIPDSVYLKGVTNFRQSYPISCESRTAVDWADFFGVQIYESDFQFALPLSDNPDKGFVGDVNDSWGQVPPYSYGVHAAPVATLLKEEYGLSARAARNFSLDNLKKEIASGQPLIAWVIGNMVGGIPSEYIDQAGDKVTVAAYEHTVIVTGYGVDHIRYLNNGNFFQVPIDTFLNSWGVLGNMVIYHKDPGDRY
ncbi:MAG: C39 family peptidase [Anaerolineaceae bacterium]|nr:C39 family peptidase [Anaerolineaceae bacterium]